MKNNFTKRVVEENINEAIEYYYNQFNDYVDTYKAISENLIEKDYHSISSNYNALFLHYLMKNHIEIDEFDRVIKTIYDSGINMEHTFYRFFGASSREHSLKEFLDLPNDKNDASIWEHMGYFFLDIKNNACTIAQDRLQYIQSMCNHLTSAHIMALHSSGFVGYLSQCSKNIEDLKPLFRTIQNNDVFEIALDREHPSFLSSFFLNISNEAYFLNDDEKFTYYNKLENIINNNEKHFLDKLFTYSKKHNQSKYEFRLDFGLLKFLNILGSDKVISYINQVYQSAIEHELGKEHRKKNLYQIESSLAHDISSSLDVGFNKISFQLNLDNIDTGKSFHRNYIYIKLLEILIENNLNPKVPQSVRDYIEKEIHNDELAPFEELTFLVDKKLIRNYFKFAELDETLPNRENTPAHRMKI